MVLLSFLRRRLLKKENQSRFREKTIELEEFVNPVILVITRASALERFVTKTAPIHFPKKTNLFQHPRRQESSFILFILLDSQSSWE